MRGFAGWPGTWSLFNIEGDAEPLRLKIVTTKVVADAAADDLSSKGNTVELVGKALRVVCKDGSVLDVLEVQPPGKKVMDSKAFANGLRGRAFSWRPNPPKQPAGAA